MRYTCKGMLRKTAAVLAAVFAVLCALTLPAAAEAVETYTAWDRTDGGKQTVYSREMYRVERVVSAGSLGMDSKLSGITDICCGPDGKLYVLCGGKSRLVVLNGDYTLDREITVHGAAGAVRYKDAQGIYVAADGSIFLCDTENGRVLVLDGEGAVLREYHLPESSVIPDSFVYQPTRVVRDTKGYTYILSLGSYYGAILYSPTDEFMGFYGANTVQGSVLTTISYLWDLLTSNDEKKSQQARSLPYAFTDICVGGDGYVYTCTGSTSYTAAGTNQIRMLSPGGSQILYKRSFDGSASSSGYNFLESDLVKRLGKTRPQNLVALDVSADGYIYALDSTYGRLYLYDADCNLLSAFGGGVGAGERQGTFSSAAAMAVCGDDVVVADAKKSSLTVFSLTDYGRTVLRAQSRFLEGDYAAAKADWETVLQQDGNSLLAYRGLSKAYYAEGNMDAAMEYAQAGMDYVTYDYARQQQVSTYIKSHFVWLFLIGLLVVGALAAFLVYVGKRETPLIRNATVRTATRVFFHPFQAFDDVKYKGLGSLWIAAGLTVLLFASVTLKSTSSGFLFSQSDAHSYSSLYTLAQTVGLLVLWSLCNWAVCTIFSGKAKLREVFIVSAYSMMPLILFNFLFVLLSQVLSLNSVSLMHSLYVVVLAFTFFIFSVGIIKVQEYTFSKFLLTGLATVVLMFLAAFVLFIVVILVQQFGDFLYSLFMEVVYR